MQPHRQHYQDLPAIPEETFADDASMQYEGIIDHVKDIGGDDASNVVISYNNSGKDGADYASTPNEGIIGHTEDIGDNETEGDVVNGYELKDAGAADEFSNVEDESCANSYAFTLDNIGWDEECSLGGSVVGSIIAGPLYGGSDNSFAHTPTSHLSHSSERERELQETCQKFGLPYSEDWLKVISSQISSGGSSDSLDKDGGSSILGSISVSSGSADSSWDQLRKQKIDQLWPWSASAKTSREENGQREINNMEKDSISPSISADMKGGSSMWAKELWTSFNRRMEGTHEMTNSSTAEQLSVGDSADENRSNAQRSNPRPDIKNKGPCSTVKSLYEPTQHLVRIYRESDFKTRLGVGTTILILILSFVTILSLPTPDSDVSLISGNSGNDGPDSSTNNSTDLTVISIPADTAIVIPSTSSVDAIIVPSKSPTSASSLAPSARSPGVDLASNGGPYVNVEPCVDAYGRYQTSGGKKRQCEWMSLYVEPGALYSDFLYAECGERSELGLNCRYTCRAYNGCLLALQRSGGGGGGGGGLGLATEGSGGSESLTYQVSNNVALAVPASSLTMDLPSTEEEVLSDESEMTLVSSPLLLRTNTWSIPSMRPSTKDMSCVDYQGYYLNHHGLPRQCSWLISTSDPTDETRRMHNCGYADSNQYSAGTDLGRMCKKTCGTCE
jgi:hypothetical protein